LWGELTGAIWGLLAAVFVDALFAVILVGWDASRIRRTVASLGGELGAS
jgi:hydrogenase-4 membrane subunit HyfE